MSRKRPLAMLKMRCPRCLEGSVFSGLYAMNKECPRCGLVFEREPGYFLGAFYVSYGLGIALVLPLVALLYHLDWSPHAIAGASAVQLALMSPLTFRYARLSWMYMDQRFDPR